jgi:hypothetical protein
MDFRNRDIVFFLVLLFWNFMIIPAIIYDWNPLIHNFGLIITLVILIIIDKYTKFLRN